GRDVIRTIHSPQKEGNILFCIVVYTNCTKVTVQFTSHKLNPTPLSPSSPPPLAPIFQKRNP
ncbi:hypothetical protein PanWU01x14_299160, partial [Parasponia andersonii]